MFHYKKAQIDDIEFLVKNRMSLLKSANNLKSMSDLNLVEKQLYQYYKWSIPSNNHVAYLAFKESVCVGTGGICFYQVLPTYHNPTGEKAYITNMYTLPEFRNQGIASHILECLVKEALQKGVNYISLEATKSGRPIYEKYGFIQLYTEMQLKNETYDLEQNNLH